METDYHHKTILLNPKTCFRWQCNTGIKCRTPVSTSTLYCTHHVISCRKLDKSNVTVNMKYGQSQVTWVMASIKQFCENTVKGISHWFCSEHGATYTCHFIDRDTIVQCIHPISACFTQPTSEVHRTGQPPTATLIKHRQLKLLATLPELTKLCALRTSLDSTYKPETAEKRPLSDLAANYQWRPQTSEPWSTLSLPTSARSSIMAEDYGDSYDHV